jgi:uronate dehydrogenase
MRRVVITGACGVVGQVLLNGLRRLSITPVDLPQCDLRVGNALDDVLPGACTVVHLAWNSTEENYLSGTIDPGNSMMAANVLASCAQHRVPRVILASSVHADTFPAGDGRLLTTSGVPVPDSPYGASKLFVEALGRHYATHGIDVIAIRLGGVTPDDSRKRRNATEQAVRLSHADGVAAFQRCVDAPTVPGRYACFYAVSDNADRCHDVSNEFGWRPQDR